MSDNLSFETEPDETGASAVEYALLVALVATIIIGAVLGLGTTVRGLFESVPGF